MARYDVVDEGIIDADLSTVFKAYMDEFTGKTHWWMPLWASKPRGDKRVVQKGEVADIIVNRRGKSKFAARVTDFVENRLVYVEFFEGDFIGTGEWTFEPSDGKTKVRFRWKVKTNKLSLTLVALFLNIGKIHSEVIQGGFKALNRYLRARMQEEHVNLV